MANEVTKSQVLHGEVINPDEVLPWGIATANEIVDDIQRALLTMIDMPMYPTTGSFDLIISDDDHDRLMFGIDRSGYDTGIINKGLGELRGRTTTLLIVDDLHNEFGMDAAMLAEFNLVQDFMMQEMLNPSDPLDRVALSFQKPKGTT